MTNEQILREALEEIAAFAAFKMDCPTGIGHIIKTAHKALAATAASDNDSTDAARYRIMRYAIVSQHKQFLDAIENLFNSVDVPDNKQFDWAIDLVSVVNITATKKEAP